MSSLLYMEKFGNTVSLRYPFKVKVGDVDMRLILILSMLLLTQLFFNLAHGMLYRRRVLPPSSAKVTLLMKRNQMTTRK